MRRGDIYEATLDPTFGHEQKGRRPVLIVSTTDFNQMTKTPVIVPITQGGDFARTKGFAVSLVSAGTETMGIIRCDQPRAVDLRSRNAKKLESVPEYIMEEVLGKISVIFE